MTNAEKSTISWIGWLLTPSRGRAQPTRIMLDPVPGAIANAPIDDESETEEERQAVAVATEWLKHNKPIPFDVVLADLGLTLEDVKGHREPE